MSRDKQQEFREVSEVSNPSPDAKIQGVVSLLSPMKKAKTCSYFDGEVTDGKVSMRVFGFDSSVQRKLVEFEESKKPVAISICEVKRLRMGEQLEILVTKRSEVEKSFDVTESKYGKVTVKVMVLSKIQEVVPFQRVTVEVKTLRVEDAEEVSGEKRKQDILVGDSSGTVRVAIWEGEIGKIDEDKSYRLSGMMVKEFRQKKFLSTAKVNSMIEDIGDVEEEGRDDVIGASDEGHPVQLNNVRVLGVLHLDKYNGCLKCHAKVVPVVGEADLGNCMRCGMMQCLDACTKGLSAQLMVEGTDGPITLRAFAKAVQNIAQKPSDEVTMAVLLKAKPFTPTYRDGIIVTICRKI